MRTLFKTILTTVFLLLFQGPAAAQVYKCDLGNRVIYSDKPCPSKADETKLDIQADPAPEAVTIPADKNRYMTQLNAAVKDAISKNDFARAEKLALTQQHWDWINQAKPQSAPPAQQTATDKSNSVACIEAQRNYQQGFDNTTDSPEDMEARARRVREACGTPEVEPTYIQRPPFINRPPFGLPYLNPNSSLPGAAVPSPMGGRANPPAP